MKRFLAGLFFVLGFISIFSLLGVTLQVVVGSWAYQFQAILQRLAGLIIILFSLVLLGWITFPYTIQLFSIKKKQSLVLTSFLFGATFALGWTPCVGPLLAIVLGLAVTNPGYAFLHLFIFGIGLGIPFLLIALGFETKPIQQIININQFQKLFGLLLLITGIMIFFNLFQFLLFRGIEFEFTTLSLPFSFIAGLLSFLSPCVLPLVPGYISYLASLDSR